MTAAAVAPNGSARGRREPESLQKTGWADGEVGKALVCSWTAAEVILFVRRGDTVLKAKPASVHWILVSCILSFLVSVRIPAACVLLYNNIVLQISCSDNTMSGIESLEMSGMRRSKGQKGFHRVPVMCFLTRQYH